MKGNMSQAQKRTDHNAMLNRDAENQHPISAIAGLKEALDSKVPTTRKINGQTLDNDVEIKNVESADKLKTARAINGVEFDGTASIKVYGENELPTQLKPIYTKGWYRFAQIDSTATTAVIRIARNFGNGYPETYTAIFNATYENCNFTQISSLRRSTDQWIPKIRAVYLQRRIYLEFYYNYDLGNRIATKVSDIIKSHETDTFSNIEFEEGSIPEGFNVEEFALSGSPLKASSIEIGSTKLTEAQLQSLLALLT